MSPAAPASVRIAPPPESWTGEVPRRTRRTRSKDRPTAAMVFGILSLVFDPLFLPALIGILYGAGSLRAGTAHRGRAIAGIVCGAVGAALGLAGIVLLIVTRLVLPPLESHALERSIAGTAARSGLVLTSIECPIDPSSAPRLPITCSAVEQSGVAISITASRDASGALSLRAAPTS